VRIISGGVRETTELLNNKFDHIMYTGNGVVGRIVMTAAAKFLTPVTLELGGKSPCIVDKDVKLRFACERICFGKWTNAGQTCIAPDYVLVHKDVEQQFLKEMVPLIKQFWGQDPKKSEDYGKIITPRHTQRVVDLLAGESVYYGGAVDVANCYVEPTIVNPVKLDSKLMQEEIFGPILPVIPYSTTDEAIQFVNAREKPLALYLFTTNKQVEKQVLSETSSGGGCVNETLLHCVIPELPFGGVGESGMGAYNAQSTFDTFTHKKSFLIKKLAKEPDFRWPPYDKKKEWWITFLAGLKVPSLKTIVLKYVLPVSLAAAVYYYRSELRREFY